MKTYGIYICYPPTVDLRSEGLGRYLAALIMGAEKIEHVQFIIVCPSWAKEILEQLFESEGVSLKKVSIIAPAGRPIALKLLSFITNLKKKRKNGKKKKIESLLTWSRNEIANIINRIGVKIAIAYKISSLLPILFDILALIIFFTPMFFLHIITNLLHYFKLTIISSKFFKTLDNQWHKLSDIFISHKNNDYAFNLYNAMETAESERMLEMIKSLKNVLAWYAPTAFWKSFSKITSPKVMCVPDVVPSSFPGGFSLIEGQRFYNTVKNIKRNICHNNFFITYSLDVKSDTLVKRFNVPEENIYIVKHAPCKLDHWFDKGSYREKETSLNYAKSLLKSVLSRQLDTYMKNINIDFNFIFYASQIRPNKNILALLKAYNYLLKKKFINHKLLLTGTINSITKVAEYILKNRLEEDVFFLNNLSIQEVAACYKLADLAVNPTLSEGGCPFTFTEALSVGTPVVMGRIAVTEEVLTDPNLQEMTFFDPYDWMSIADKIEWALANLDNLRELQLETYNRLVKRTWEDVVREHIAVMDNVAEKYHAALHVEE
ncbi:glycosyltransferase [Salmonella enterica]